MAIITGYTNRAAVRHGLAVLLLTLSLAACSLPKQQRFTPEIQAPKLTAQAIITSDNAALPYKHWLPKANSAPKAVFLALHGFNDYSNAFAAFGTFAASKGYAVYAYDQRGFGRAPQTGIWANNLNLWRDLAQSVTLLKQRYPHTPLYILGESMGGAVAITALVQEEFPAEKVAGVILSAPAVWGDRAMNPFYQFILWAAAHTVPSLEVTGKGIKVQASDNIPMLVALGKDPLIIKKTRIDAIYGLVELMGKAQKDIAQLKTPVLYLYGVKDQIIPPAPTEQAMLKLKTPHTLAIYQKGWHMLLRDLQAEVVYHDIDSWVVDDSKELPSGAMVSPSKGTDSAPVEKAGL